MAVGRRASFTASLAAATGPAGPYAGVIFDQAGNLYGTTASGGTPYQLTLSGSGWAENTLHTFQYHGDGTFPYGGLIFDESGNLYGTTSIDEPLNGGTVYELEPSSGNWAFALLHSFFFSGAGCCPGPLGSLIIDTVGNLYGTTSGEGAHLEGNVFKLSPSNGGWTYTSLHDFTGGSDGGFPYGSLVFDANGNLYGTTSFGGAYDGVVVFEITP